MIDVDRLASVHVEGHEHRALDAGWELLRAAPSTFDGPAAIPKDGWCAAVVPGTVGAVGGLAAEDLHAWDWWYRCRFEAPRPGARVLLRFDGLATLAEVFLNGTALVVSESMFEAYAVPVESLLAPINELYIVFRALEPVLRQRRPRGRFPTRLVEDKNLRFVRTSLLGAMPGAGPRVRPVGPFRPITLVAQPTLFVRELAVRPRLEGDRGTLDLALVVEGHDGWVPSRARVRVGSTTAELVVEPRESNIVWLGARVVLENVAPWWPHTHGDPARYEVVVTLERGDDARVITLPKVGFRSVACVTEGGDFALHVNDVPIFARGACWVPLDVLSLGASESALRGALLAFRDAGMNMVRVTGTTVYETDLFHDLCDELGILVFQDFMFARMDYPAEDPDFLARCEAEARQLLARIGSRPSLAVLCGNTEVAQQAAMMGMPRETWSNPLFDELLPRVAHELAEGVPYVSSTPSGGALPFHLRSGPSHYYAIGAYGRPLEEARAHGVRFASECLAFSNVPEDESLAWLSAAGAAAHHPLYRERVPRDPFAGWDFGDVTDTYVEALFGVDVRRVRAVDHDRYLFLCRATTCAVMERVMGVLRASSSQCRGALVYTARDPWAGAGFGVVDHAGRPKSVWFGLRRAFAPLAMWFVDEGVDGLTMHLANDRTESLAARLELGLYRADGARLEHFVVPVALAVRAQVAVSVEGQLGRFVDASHAYRFGPPAHVMAAARLLGEGGRVLAAATQALLDGAFQDPGLVATASSRPDGRHVVTVESLRPARFVVVESPGHDASDAYFHVAPGIPHEVVFVPRPDAPPFRARVRCLDSVTPSVVRVGSS